MCAGGGPDLNEREFLVGSRPMLHHLSVLNWKNGRRSFALPIFARLIELRFGSGSIAAAMSVIVLLPQIHRRRFLAKRHESGQVLRAFGALVHSNKGIHMAIDLKGQSPLGTYLEHCAKGEL